MHKKERPIIYYGAGKIGAAFHEIFGDDVYCFADGYTQKETFCGKKVISLEELSKISKGYTVVVTLEARLYYGEVIPLLAAYGIDSIYCGDYYKDGALECFLDKIKYNDKYRSTHEGDSCFIIGNGPSLTAEDLQILKDNDVFTFASNRIYKIYDKTSYRPDIYFSADRPLFLKDRYIIENFDCDIFVYYDTVTANAVRKLKNYDKIHMYNVKFFNWETKTNFSFSETPFINVVGGCTVTTIMIQFAVYMGFKKIYLLGVDCNYVYDETLKNKPSNHFYKDTEDGIDPALPYRMLRNYEAVEEYSRDKDFKVYNATRGGKLEMFERVNIDELFVKTNHK